VYSRPGGNHEEAEKLYRETWDEQRRILGPEHPDTLLTMNNLGLLWTQQPEKFAAAEQMLTEAAQARGRALGAAHRDTLESWVQTAIAQMLQRKFTQAEATLRPVCNAYVDAKLDVWQRYACQVYLGECLVAEKRYQEAEPVLLAGYDGLAQRKASIPATSRPTLDRAADWLVRLYTEEGKLDLAAQWKQKPPVAGPRK
jgi:hypothetical protein